MIFSGIGYFWLVICIIGCTCEESIHSMHAPLVQPERLSLVTHPVRGIVVSGDHLFCLQAALLAHGSLWALPFLSLPMEADSCLSPMALPSLELGTNLMLFSFCGS